MIGITNGITAGDISPIEDIVLARYDEKGILKEAFSLILILAADVSVNIEEVPVPYPSVGEGGVNIYGVDVDLTLFQTDASTAKRMTEHGTYLWHVHILYQNLNYRSSVTVSSGGRRTALSANDPALLKYNNVEAFRNEFGVGLRTADAGIGIDRRLRIIGKGATCEHVSKTLSSKNAFYAMFPSMFTSIDSSTGV